jgi:hypothetical protein
LVLIVFVFPWSFRVPMQSLVNCLPWSGLKISGRITRQRFLECLDADAINRAIIARLGYLVMFFGHRLARHAGNCRRGLDVDITTAAWMRRIASSPLSHC